MSEGAGLDWGILPLGGWESNSKAFKGDYVIEVGHDGLFFVTKRTNIVRPRQCEHVEHIGPDFQTLELAKSFCEQYENDLLSEHKTRPAGNASTFGPVPASQERVESALDEDRIRTLEKAVTKLNAEVAVMSVRLDTVTKRNETDSGPVCTLKGRNPLYQGGADDRENEPESAILVEVRRLLLEQYNQGASLYAKVSRILEELKASKKS